MADNISFENKYQKDLYDDFTRYLTLINFHLLIELKKDIERPFDDKDYKSKILNEWLSIQKNYSKEKFDEYINSMSGNNLLSALKPDVEDIHHQINKDLTYMKKVISKIIDL